MELTKFAKDISYMAEALGDGAERLLHGSYSDRHPHLGRMWKCPFCGNRRREFQSNPCCTVEWIIRHENMFGKSLVRRMRHRRHSNHIQKKIHDLVHDLSDETKFVESKDDDGNIVAHTFEINKKEYRKQLRDRYEGLAGFWTPKELELAHIPNFAEKVVNTQREQKSKSERQQQKLSRKINRSQ